MLTLRCFEEYSMIQKLLIAQRSFVHSNSNERMWKKQIKIDQLSIFQFKKMKALLILEQEDQYLDIYLWLQIHLFQYFFLQVFQLYDSPKKLSWTIRTLTSVISFCYWDHAFVIDEVICRQFFYYLNYWIHLQMAIFLIINWVF